MTTKQRQWLLAILVSAGLLAVLLRFTDFAFPDMSRLAPRWLVLVLAAHMLAVCCRGALFRALAREKGREGVAGWIRLAARHQAIFSILPSGVGDFSFPFLAKRFVALETEKALRVMILFRQRDLVALTVIAVAGATIVADQTFLAGIALFAGAICLWFADDIVSFAATILGKFIRRGKVAGWLKLFAMTEKLTLYERATSWVLTVVIWAASTSAVLAAFFAVGQHMTIGAAFLFLALINAAGVVAISVAGLGVSELGATSALVLTGRSIQEAAATALVVRPTLLLSMLICSLFLDLVLGLCASRRSR